MVKYYLDKNNQFIIEGYDKAKTFASFMPGIAGIDGIPMWVYYVNRGQAIAGFGIENKENPILDFVPANMAYRRTELTGFRTFIKVNGKVHEAFSSISSCDVERKMAIDTNVLSLVEINKTLNLKVTVKYFNISHENYAGLVRKVAFVSLDGVSLDVEVLDGLTTIWPAGVNNYTIKNMSNLAVAWFDVFNEENKIPFYKNRSTTEDTAEVGVVETGHFYASVDDQDTLLNIIYDNDLVFGYNTTLTLAEGFEEKSLAEIVTSKQVSANKIPGAFTALKVNGKEKSFYSVSGKMSCIDTLNEKAKHFTYDYFVQKENEAIELGLKVANPVDSKTSLPIFDAYVKQSFVDNLLRGGYPLVFDGKEGKIIYHVYSRIHGDMEREYNNFFVEPAFFSQGNGNFRDVNQNRRNDVYFVKEAGLYNIKQFMELIQLDGQNPLVIKGSSLILDKSKLTDLLTFVKTEKEQVKKILNNKFTPGKLLTYLSVNKVTLSIDSNEFLNSVLKNSVQEIESEYGGGYWSDHWTYNMDLIDNYLNVYPDKLEELMFTKNYRFFESHVTVLPRIDKYVLTKEGKVLQLEPLLHDKEKINRLGLNTNGTNWSKDKDGSIYKTDLFVKLLSLGLNKVCALDQFGLGIMMDTDKPGWNDAMNGLPGIFGSGLSETVETRRITKFLLNVVKKYDCVVNIPSEIYKLLKQVSKLISANLEDAEYFEQVQTARELYREEVRFGLTGSEEQIKLSDLKELLEGLDDQIESAIKKALAFGKGTIPTYLTYTPVEYEVLDHYHPHLGLPNVKVTKWSCRALPLYLEAPARYLKQVHDIDEAKSIYTFVKNSGMYDELLKMYITSESLENETLSIGRARAFTPGWLEREACFMHMEYKYLIGLLKSGLYEEYFNDIKTCLPPFMNPKVYGRSTLENSSFIASSKNPNPSNHGRGFVARMTGTTSEMITMWLLMMTGKKLFSFENNELVFTLNPILNHEFFDESNQVHFRLLNSCDVTYLNKSRKNTYGTDQVSTSKYTLTYALGNVVTIDSKVIVGTYANDIRNGLVVKILVELK
ncbi:MAG: Six-hairpin glycosidase-like protein [Haloplasmataceae bacterium]|jgi:hypothetical protein|nr:Six-hairpin glycosidase-like protein [Haloplasmataceae bacterium]